MHVCSIELHVITLSVEWRCEICVDGSWTASSLGRLFFEEIDLTSLLERIRDVLATVDALAKRRGFGPWRWIYHNHFISHEIWLCLGNKTPNHNSGLGTAFFQNLQLSVGHSAKLFCPKKSEQCSVVTFFTSAKKNKQLDYSVHLTTLVGSTAYHVTRPELTEQRTTTDVPSHTAYSVAWRYSDWFSSTIHWQKRGENVEFFTAVSIDRKGSPPGFSLSLEILVFYRVANLQTGLAFAV